MKKKIHDFDVVAQMVTNGSGIRVSTTAISVEKVKKGGHIKFGIDLDTMTDVALSMATGNGEYFCMAIIVDMKEFRIIKQKLNSKK